jgi:hypothetical protein
VCFVATVVIRNIVVIVPVVERVGFVATVVIRNIVVMALVVERVGFVATAAIHSISSKSSRYAKIKVDLM